MLEHLERRELLTAGGGFTAGGLLGQYFSNTTLTGTPVFQRTDNRVDFNWSAAPDWGNNLTSISGSASIPFANNNFSVRWTGQLIPTFSETYTFSTVSDDGVRLFINGQTVIDDWTSHTTTTDTGTFAFTAGQTYNIELDYYQASDNAVVQLSWSSPNTPQAVIEPGVSLGVNVEANSDYSGLTLFANVIDESRRFGSPTAPWDGSAPVDALGNPTADFGVVAIDTIGGVPSGTYALSFGGLARISSVAGSVGITNVVYNATTNTTTAQIIVAAGQTTVDLAFTSTQRTPQSAVGTGLTNLQLMMPVAPGSSQSLPTTAVFNPAAIQYLGQFTTLRLMDYSSMQQNTDVNWSDRTLPGAANFQTGTPEAGPWEYAVQLANESGKDLWIDVPISASNDYITKLAQLIRFGSDGVNPYTGPTANPIYAGLNPNLKVYVEYSNEVWNTAYRQYGINVAAAQAEVAAGGSTLNFDGTTNAGILAMRRYAEQVVNISNIFRAVNGDAQMMATVRPLLEWQTGNANNTASQELTYIYDIYGNGDGRNHVSTAHPVNYFVYGGGGGFYTSVNDGSGSGDVTVPNGSFENGDPSWTFTGTAGLVSNGSALGNPNAPNGSSAAYLQGNGSFSETVNFTGGLADVSFYSANASGSNETFTIYYDNQPLATNYQTTFSAGGPSYARTFSLSFNTTAGAHTLRFVGTGSGTAFIDQITVETANAMYNSGQTGAYTPVATDALWARAYGIKTVNYEGGFNVGHDTPTDLQLQANLDARAGQDDLVTLTQVFQAGSDLAMYDGSSGLNAYGLAEPNIYAGPAPKLQTVINLINQAPLPLTNGMLLPLGIGESLPLPSEATWYAPSILPMRAYVVNAAAPGTYTISLFAKQNAAGTFQILVDGQKLPGTISFPVGSTGMSVPVAFTLASAGLHTITLFSTSTASGSPSLYLLGGEIVRTIDVLNAGFENPGAGWTYSGTQSLVSPTSSPPEGTRAGALTAGGDLKQTTTGWTAGVYQISFQAALANAQSTGQGISVLVDGAVAAILVPRSTSYAAFTTSKFAVSAGSHTIEFRGLTGTYLLDTVSILPVLTVDKSTGFASGSALTLNGVASVVGNTLQLTSAAGQAASAFTQTPVDLHSFATSFRIQPGMAAGNGFTFTMQSLGATALGSGGAGLGVAGLNRSVAVQFDNGITTAGATTVSIRVNGGPPVPLADLTNFLGSNACYIDIAYDGTTLTVTERDAVTGATQTQTYALNLAAVLGSSTALVGFTAGSTTASRPQQIAAWTMSSPLAIPTGWSVQDVAVPTASTVVMGNNTGTSAFMTGSGIGLQGTSDQTGFFGENWSGNGSLSGQVTGRTAATTQAGLMIRNSSAANDAFAAVVLGPNGVSFVWRATAGATVTATQVTINPSNLWLKITRTGNTVSAYYSVYGQSWVLIGTSGPLALANTAQVGLVVNNGLTSGSDAASFATVMLPTAATASFLGTNTTTQGNWNGVFGSQGYVLPQVGTLQPSYGSVTTTATVAGYGVLSTTDTRALQSPPVNGVISSTRYPRGWSGWTVNLNVNFRDTAVHKVSLYALDFLNQGLSETVQVIDPVSGVILDTRTISNFQNGVYLSWNVSGSVLIKVTSNNAQQAIVNGIFFN